jgi:ribosomal protein S18 acetylase RimI-like enzyme
VGAATHNWRVEQVESAVTLELRREVLRPYLTLDEVAAADLAVAGTVTNFAAIAPEGSIAACASLFEEPPPALLAGRVAGRRAFRLRNMASAPAYRGMGAARAVLDEVFEEVRRAGGGLFWCNAREGAVGFYAAAGLRIAGTRFHLEHIGAHFVMWRDLSAAAS